jgi:hypothetical protein
MNKNIIIICLISFLIFFTGCVEKNETSTEISSTNISSSPTPTVTQTPIIEVTSTPESSETWPKYIMRYNYYDGVLEYTNGRKVEITEVLTATINPPYTEVVYSDFNVESYETAYLNIEQGHEATREITRETYDSYEKILAEKSYVGVSLHIIYEPTPIVMDDAMQEIVDFLNEDKTNEMVYTQEENKKYIYFTKQLSKNASQFNLSFGIILLGEMGFIYGDYALNYFYINDQLYFIDPIKDEIITVCEPFDYGYGYGKLYPDESTLTVYRSDRKIIHDLDLSEICNQRILTIPIVTQTTTQDLDITLKSGYKLYQNNEYSYGFGYPEDWVMGDDFGLSDNMLQGVGMSHDTPGNGSMTVVVYSSDSKKLWDEMGGLDVLTEAGFITTRNTTVNGRVAFEVLSTENFMPGTTVRYATIQANGYYYMMTLHLMKLTAPNRTKFDDIINSWIIGNIE